MVVADLINLVINSEPEWKKWYREIENRTYIISHDSYRWHINRRGNSCKLHSRIHRKFLKWKGSKCLIRHDPAMDKLWVTVKLPDNFCKCGRRIKVDKSLCMPCAVKRTNDLKPFYDHYQIREITVLTQDFEHVYRVFKYMGVKDKLIVHHLDCNHSKRCEHIRWFISRNRCTLPKYTSKARDTSTEIVKIIK